MAFGMVVEEIQAQQPARGASKPAGPPVPCAVIGLGPQGREIMGSLAKTGYTPCVAVCDTYSSPAWLKKATESAPGAKFYTDYRKLLEQKDVAAVFVATPSHRHREIVIDALQAGKHVYCEAPLATTIEDAQAIAKAGLASKTVFQAGLQYRANKQHNHVIKFIGDLKKCVGGQAQWHRRGTWLRGAPTEERQRELNWRLYKETSPGLLGEVGIHQIDIISWFLKSLPLSVSGFGALMAWGKDGMQVPDTVQVVLEYPKNVRFCYDATLVSSFGGAYEMLLGDQLSILIRDQRAWMFKEADSSLLGWEVYAKKERFGIGDDTLGSGIAMVADATQLIAQGKEPGKVGADVTKTALYQSVVAFVDAVRTGSKPRAGAIEGYQATVVALKANEAVMTGKTITFEKEWFNLG